MHAEVGLSNRYFRTYFNRQCHPRIVFARMIFPPITDLMTRWDGFWIFRPDSSFLEEKRLYWKKQASRARLLTSHCFSTHCEECSSELDSAAQQCKHEQLWLLFKSCGISFAWNISLQGLQETTLVAPDKICWIQHHQAQENMLFSIDIRQHWSGFQPM